MAQPEVVVPPRGHLQVSKGRRRPAALCGLPGSNVECAPDGGIPREGGGAEERMLPCGQLGLIWNVRQMASFAWEDC